MAGTRVAVIDVDLTAGAGVARRTLAAVAGDAVVTDAIIPARLRLAIVDVDLTAGARKAKRTATLKPVDLVVADAVVQARTRLALVDINFALGARESWHANATERARIVQAAALVLARMRFAFVDVRLAARPGESLGAVAHERARRIHTDAIVFARRSLVAFINILGAVDALVAGRTGARVGAIDRTRVANGIGMTRIRGAGIVQVAQQTRLARRAATVEAANAIDTGGAIKAGRLHTIVDVLAAIAARPAVHADATVGAVGVRTGGAVLADRRTQRTLVHVHVTVATRKVWRAIAAIVIDAIHTGAAILAKISGTIVNVLITVLALKACK